MKPLHILTGATLLAAASAGPAQGPAKITPGLWETTVDVTDMKIAGMANVPPQMLERMKPARRVVLNCVTPAQAANPKGEMLAGAQDKCTMSKMDMAGGKISMVMRCTGGARGGAADITVNGTYTPTSYAMTSQIKASGGQGMTMNMTSKTSGKRVGPCSS